MSDNIEVGSIITVWLGSGFTRRAKILAIDSGMEDALLRWIDYNLPDEWYPIRRLT